MHHFISNQQFGSIKHHLDLFTLIPLDTNMSEEKYKQTIIQWINWPYIHHQSLHHGCHSLFAICKRIFNMEHCSCSTSILDSISTTLHPQWRHWKSLCSFLLQWLAHQLRNQQEEIIFSHFVTTLNETFEQDLIQEDKGYESCSDSLNIPTLLRWAPQIYHMSMNENLSFDPSTPLPTA